MEMMADVMAMAPPSASAAGLDSGMIELMAKMADAMAHAPPPAPALAPALALAPAPAPAPAPGTDIVLWDEYSNASTAPAPAPSIEDDEETYESHASRRSLAESVQDALEKAKDGKERAATDGIAR